MRYSIRFKDGYYRVCDLSLLRLLRPKFRSKRIAEQYIRKMKDAEEKGTPEQSNGHHPQVDQQNILV